MLHRYLIMLYEALINLGMGELGPANKIEMLLMTISSIISAFVFTNIFGQIITIKVLLDENR